MNVGRVGVVVALADAQLALGRPAEAIATLRIVYVRRAWANADREVRRRLTTLD